MMHWKASFNTSKSLLFVILAGLFIASIAFFINDQVLGSGKDLMNHVLFTQDKNTSWHTVLLRVLGPIICFNTGAAGGIFAPSLAAGASIGAYISQLLHYVDSNANILILCGMVGFLTGVTRTPFTSAILVLEMTDRHSVIFHLMLAALISHIAAMVVDKHSFYEQLKLGYIEQEKKEETNQKTIESQ
jgi:H+/Cl- antiporter ClcA